MLTRPIPSSGEALPIIGVGTSNTFDVTADRGPLDQRREVLEEMFAAGGSIIDSSPMYGRSEAVVGRLLDEMGARPKAFVATKVWTTGERAGIAQMEASARKMSAPVIDLMQIHNLVDWHTHLRTLREWKQIGRIRYVGMTHYTDDALDDLADVIDKEPIDFLQFNYSVADRAAERRLLPLAADKGVAVMVNLPFIRGDVLQRIASQPIPDWAAEFDAASWGQIMLKFVLGHPAVTCVIPGTSKPEHMRDNAKAGTGRMPDAAQRRRIVELFEMQ